MGSLCTSAAGSSGAVLGNQVIEQYGSSTVLTYAESIIGNTTVTQQFDTLKKTVTDKFNSSPQAQSQPGLLDQIMGKINGVQAQ
jgi:hypothetical protein